MIINYFSVRDHVRDSGDDDDDDDNRSSDTNIFPFMLVYIHWKMFPKINKVWWADDKLGSSIYITYDFINVLAVSISPLIIFFYSFYHFIFFFFRVSCSNIQLRFIWVVVERNDDKTALQKQEQAQTEIMM